MTTSNFNYQTLLETLREICADFAYTVWALFLRMRCRPLHSRAWMH